MLSRTFKATVKLANRPAWKIAFEVGLHPNVLSKIMTGAVQVKHGDQRVIDIGSLLGLKPEECFEPYDKEN